MISIFTIPKAFVGQTGIIQRNAIKSWLELQPHCEIILLGDDEGIEETANRLLVRHISFIEKNRFGTPLLSSAFQVAQEVAKNDLMVFVNTDIIFVQNLMETLNLIRQERFLISGRRWDLDIQYEIDVSGTAWREELLRELSVRGRMHGPSGMDYFVFRRRSIVMPPFAVGRPGWDTWLIHDMRRNRVPVIDTSEAITAIHQNHDYSHSKFGEKKRVGGPELAENVRIAGGLTNMQSLRDADWLLTKDGLKRPPVVRRIQSILSLWYPWRFMLAAKRKLRI